MAEFTDYTEIKVLNHLFNATASTAPASVHLSLHTAATTDAGGGTEVTGGGYGRQQVAFTTASGTGGSINNTAIESFTASGANYGTVVATAIWDAATTGNMLCHDNDFTDTAVNDGDTLSFAATTGIVITLA